MLENVVGFSPVDKWEDSFDGSLLCLDDLDWLRKNTYYCTNCDIVYDYGTSFAPKSIDELCPYCHERTLEVTSERMAKRYATIGY